MEGRGGKRVAACHPMTSDSTNTGDHNTTRERLNQHYALQAEASTISAAMCMCYSLCGCDDLYPSVGMCSQGTHKSQPVRHLASKQARKSTKCLLVGTA